MDKLYVAGKAEIPLELLEAVAGDACRVAGIGRTAVEGEPVAISRLRLRIVRSILETMLRGHRNPSDLRVAALRSTFRCCVKNEPSRS